MTTTGGVFATSAAAHTELTGSTPKNGGTLPAPPRKLVLTFSDPMNSRYSRVAVEGPSGDSVTTGPVKVDGSTVTRALAEKAPGGRYTVSYRVVSADGHPISATFTYRVTAPTSSPQLGAAGPANEKPSPSASTSAPAESSAPNSEGSAQNSGGGLPGVIKTVIGVALLALLGGVAYVWRRGTRRGV